jgi:nitroimidazol reductase NimA-like FMN-containing flavoprotein (pyridoxamine 5'-phosphate oxidase superfamily)
MPTPSGIRNRDLSPDECGAILARNNVGRIAYAHASRVEIEPLNYVFADGWIYCRTSRGTKVTLIEHQPWVAFEVDEVDALFDWRSVVVRGGVHFQGSESTPIHERAFAHGVELLRKLVPGTGTDHDPVPFRLLVMGIHLDEVTGRAATPAGKA